MRLNYKILLPLMGSGILLFACLIGNHLVSAQTTATVTPVVHKSLAEQLGFTAPQLDDLQQHGMSEVAENVPFTAYGHDYHLVHIWPASIDDRINLGLGKVLLFQVDGAIAKLIWRVNADVILTYLSGNKIGRNWPIPGDWEQNGKINFGIYYVAVNTCSQNFSYLDVYTLNANGAITSRLSKIIPAGYVVESLEKGKNGSLLLRAVDIRGFSSRMNFASCRGPISDRYFELIGRSLSDVSAQHIDTYISRIGDLVYDLTTWQPQAVSDPERDSKLYAGKLMELQMIYDALGQRDNGYALMKSLATQALDANHIKRDTYLDKVFLPAMTQLYVQHQLLVPPEFVGAKPMETLDFYP